MVGSIGGLPGLRVVPLTLEDVAGAAELVRERSLDFEDVVQC
ncbi:MAG: hypothetical protein QXJ21_04285 [Thermofilum sp.]